MSFALKTDLVAFTGCQKGDILIGAQPVNRNMKIRVFCAQRKGDNSQIKGGFKLLHEGAGTYGPAMAEFVGRHFENAQELVTLNTRESRSKKMHFCTPQRHAPN